MRHMECADVVGLMAYLALHVSFAHITPYYADDGHLR